MIKMIKNIKIIIINFFYKYEKFFITVLECFLSFSGGLIGVAHWQTDGEWQLIIYDIDITRYYKWFVLFCFILWVDYQNRLRYRELKKNISENKKDIDNAKITQIEIKIVKVDDKKKEKLNTDKKNKEKYGQNK